VVGPSGGGVGIAEVVAVVSWHGGYLIMRESSASWAAVVAWRECIRLCSGDTSLGLRVAGYRFFGVSIISSVSWLLVCCFLLLGGLRTASRMS
jgi:hypothetical protein